MTERKCSYCKIVQPIGQFYKDSGKSGGYGYRCRTCDKRQQTEKYHRVVSTPEGRDKLRKASYWRNSKWKYGIGKKEFDALMKKQKGRCAICRSILLKKVDIDHCHQSGKVRGLLCHRCNTAIGFLGEDVSILRSAIKYLSQ